jgi:hypothetical protein
MTAIAERVKYSLSGITSTALLSSIAHFPQSWNIFSLLSDGLISNHGEVTFPGMKTYLAEATD